MKRSEKLLGKTGDELALEILLDPTLTPAERDAKLAKTLKQFTAKVEKKLSR